MATKTFRNFHQKLDCADIDIKDVQILIESTRTRHYLKRKPTYALLDIVYKYRDVLTEGGLQSDKTVQRHVTKLLVGTHITVAYRNRLTGRPKIMHNLKAISRKKFPRSQYQLMYTIAQVRTLQILVVGGPKRDND